MKKWNIITICILFTAYSCTNNMTQIVDGYVTGKADETTIWQNINGTGIDTTGDGIPNGIDITNDGTADILLLDLTGSSRRVDINGDSVVDFYMNIDNLNNVTFSTGANGAGSAVTIKYDATDTPIGYDTNGDGLADITLTGTAITYYTVGGAVTTLASDMIVSLSVNGTHAENLPITAASTTYVFLKQLQANDTYEIKIVAYPSTPTIQNCSLINSVNIITANVTNADIKCGVYADTLDTAAITTLFGTPMDNNVDGLVDSIDIDYDGTYNSAVDIDIVGSTTPGSELDLDLNGGGADMYLCRNASGVYFLNTAATCAGTNLKLIRRNGVPEGYDNDADSISDFDINNVPMYALTVTMGGWGATTWVRYRWRINAITTIFSVISSPTTTYTYPRAFYQGEDYRIDWDADSTGGAPGCTGMAWDTLTYTFGAADENKVAICL